MRRRFFAVVLVVLILSGGIFFALYDSTLWSRFLRVAGFMKGEKNKSPGLSTPKEGGQRDTAGEMSLETPPTVEIPDDKRDLIGVKVVKVTLRPLSKVIRTVGRIEYDERKLVTINTKIEGWIEKLYVDYTGRFVQKGEPLVEIYSPELLATQQEFINTVRWMQEGEKIKDERIARLITMDAKGVYEAAKTRLRLWDISDVQIKKIEESKTPIRTLTIYSPVSGYVLQKMALQGMRVMPGEKLFDVADLSTLWVVADIYEYELPLVQIGQRAKISLSYLPDHEFSAAVDYVYPTLNAETRTARVRFTIPNLGGKLKPQMYTNVEIKVGLGVRLAVPSDAVIDTGVRQIVYVDKGEGNFEPREVAVGLKTEDMTEIISGLKVGEKVATAATFLIDSEAQLKGITAPAKKHSR